MSSHLTSQVCRNIALVTFGVVLTMALMALGWGVMHDPEGFSRLFLRTGGRLVARTTNNPRATGIVLALLVGATWLGIGLACGIQSWRHRAASRNRTRSS